MLICIINLLELITQGISLEVSKSILIYLCGTVGYGLVYISTNDFRLIVYTDSYWEGCMDDMESKSRYSFSVGLVVVSWSIKKQPIVSLSTTEA